ncbi:MAG: hypothetical protein KJ868_06950 [Gammaproteobacteria bacterium]|nr:hypothetical protein [Gammaproteobacteria bacterium]MBU2237729.1 hypothetical protein [Gammaproteobacteria bacterium]MBU2411994.1 hypothetical protein [Gammaproteobacteria bacterium]
MRGSTTSRLPSEHYRYHNACPVVQIELITSCSPDVSRLACKYYLDEDLIFIMPLALSGLKKLQMHLPYWVYSKGGSMDTGLKANNALASALSKLLVATL